MNIEDDPRFLKGIEYFNAGDFYEASEEFEDLFFEAVRDEIEFIRVFLQVSVGLHHVERGQLNAAIERLEDGIVAIGKVDNSRGIDFDSLAQGVRSVIPRIRERMGGATDRIVWPQIKKKP